jgi:hypothetical protein
MTLTVGSHRETFVLTHEGGHAALVRVYRGLRRKGMDRSRAHHVIVQCAIAMAPYAHEVQPDWVDEAWKPVLEGSAA